MKSKIYTAAMLGIAICFSESGMAQANVTLSNLTNPTAVNVNLLPSASNVRDLGSATRRWRYIHLDSILYLNGERAFYSAATNFFVGPLAGTQITTGQRNTGLGTSTLGSLTTGNYNAGFGYSTLKGTTTGIKNAGLGYMALFSNKGGSHNTAVGFGTLYNNTTGYSNVAIGTSALYKNITGNQSVAIGDSALLNNENNYHNVAVGSKALYLNTTGYYNVAVGYQSLYSNTVSGYNTALGYQALYSTTGSAYDNTGTGFQALYTTTSGSRNTADGVWALLYNTTGSNNTASGVYALMSNTSGNDNIAQGFYAAYANRTGNSNVALGSHALYINSTGSNLVAVGDSALYNQSGGIGSNTAAGSKSLYANTTGSYNSAFGSRSLYSNTTGSYNVAVGPYSLNANTTSTQNTAVGYNAMLSNNSGGYNTALGAYAGYYNSTNSTFIGWDTYGASSGVTNSTALGYHAPTTASNQVRIGDGNVTSIGGQVAWSVFSDGRFKKNVKEDVPGLQFIKQLRPVTYNVDAQGFDNALVAMTKRPSRVGASGERSAEERSAMDAKSKIVYTGFIAQEVEAAAKKMNYEFSGVDAPKNSNDFYGLRYSEFVVPLVKAVQELAAQNERLTEQVALLQAKVDNQTNVSSVVTDASLSQNSPNPFKGSTIINYNLPQRFNSAQVVIYDASGKTLKQINISGQGRGYLKLDAASLASGAYSYSLIVDGKLVDTRKMVLAK